VDYEAMADLTMTIPIQHGYLIDRPKIKKVSLESEKKLFKILKRLNAA
jgi:hypothetical protein